MYRPIYRRACAAPLHTILFIALLALLFSPAYAQQAPQPVASSSIYLPLVVQAPTGQQPGNPIIESFEAGPTSGPMAAEVELRWRVRNATQLRIEPNVGDVLGGASFFVRPLATTTYTITATNERGTVSAATTYTVNAPPVANPITVQAQFDTARATSLKVGPEGDDFEATGADGTRYRLTIPAEALLYTEVITLTPVAIITDIPFPTSALRAVAIAPEGLVFLEPATLTITPPAPPAAGTRTLGLAYQGTGSEFHLRALLAVLGRQAGERVQLSVATARSYGTAETSAEDDMLAPLTPRAPSDPTDAAEHVVITEDENPAPGAATIYYQWVKPLLQAAVSDSDQLDSAARNYIQWRASIKQRESEFREEISAANLLLGEALRSAGARATERCNDKHPEQGFALQRFAGYAKRFGLVNTRAELLERLKQCWQFTVRFQSQITETGEGYGYLYQLQATLPLKLAADGTRLTASGPLAWTDIAWTGDSGECVFAPVGTPSTFDAASGSFGLRLQPASLTSPEVKLSFAYQHGTPSETTTITCPDVPPITQSTTAWASYFGQMHAFEVAEGGFVARQQTRISGTIPPWSYQHTTSGPSGQAVAETTTITLEHTPGS